MCMPYTLHDEQITEFSVIIYEADNSYAASKCFAAFACCKCRLCDFGPFFKYTC
jgi:hypothetical protein